jgi:biotin synthase
LAEHPESVQINALVAVSGTILAKELQQQTGQSIENAFPTALEMARMIATARIVMPRTIVRLSAGRMKYSEAEQALLMHAGANSIFYGETLLTTPNPEEHHDKVMFQKLGMIGKPAFAEPMTPPLSKFHEEIIEETIEIHHVKKQ